MMKHTDMNIHVIDSHTGGEPTRVVVSGGPNLGSGPLVERRELFRTRFDSYRSAIVNEPRGSDALVGALLCESEEAGCASGVIFFNNVGYLGMCGHGAIGVIATLAHLGRIRPGLHRIETPVGVVSAELHETGEVTIGNVESYRLLTNVVVNVESFGIIRGDVAWGGNWFFLVAECPIVIDLGHLEALTDFTWRVRQALARDKITGAHGAEIDHVEVFGQASRPDANSRNFVLCPGKAYDRSPCGTGTSAKLACLYTDGKLGEGDIWRQESIVGSIFEGHVRVRDGHLYPFIKGMAHINAEANLVLTEADPFCWGIRP
jgi:4-hydroxyproline epimerase